MSILFRTLTAASEASMSNLSAEILSFRTGSLASETRSSVHAGRSDGSCRLAPIFEGDLLQSGEAARRLFQHGYIILDRPARVGVLQKIEDAMRNLMRWLDRH